MSDDRLIPTHPGVAGQAPLSQSSAAAPAPYGGEAYYPEPFESERASVDWRRYVYALFRYKWLLVVAVMLGAGGAAVAWRSIQPTYTAEGNLWIEVERREAAGDVTPIRTSGLLEANAWIELLRSYSVLDSVVVGQKLYVNAPDEFATAFSNFSIDERFASGDFELRVGADGRAYTLATRQGVVAEEGVLGSPVGRDLGFLWTPAVGSFPPNTTVPFSVRTPRDAARSLSQQLITSMDREGNFLAVNLDGTNPERIAATLNAVLDRDVALAAELKRAKLDETLAILEEQLRYTETELADAEQDLEEFRVTTISQPTDRVAIAPGLQVTRDPVFDDFFGMRVSLEQVRRDRARLRAAMDSSASRGQIRIEALEVIPAAAASSELQSILAELVEARSQLRALRDRYADDYPPVQQLLTQIGTMENRAIPQVVDGILSELATQESDLQRRIDSASQELRAIPPRMIEEGRLDRRVTITQNLYNELRGRVETARLAAASSIPDVRILDRAQVPERPTNDMRLLIAGAILFGCLGAAMGGAILLDRNDARYRYASDVGRDIGLDILGSIPRIQGGKRGVLNAAQALEAFRELRIHIGFAYGSAGPMTLAISSPAASEGKSLIASNLAVAFSEVGQRTLLIDGDTRRGNAHKLLGRTQSPGLIDYLKDRSGQEIIQKTDHENLDFIGCGSRGISTPELLASPRMAHFIGTLKRSYDVIIVDSPPLAAGGDALILATLTSNLAVVIRTGSTEKALARAKLDQLARLPLRILGAILNDVDPTDGYHYYYSAYLPGYEPVPEEGEEASSALISGAGEPT